MAFFDLGHISPSLTLDKRGQKSQTDLSHSDYQRENELNEIQDELSTLPSPRMSDMEIDSDHDTVETDVLVRSYHEKSRGDCIFCKLLVIYLECYNSLILYCLESFIECIILLNCYCLYEL